MKILKISKKRNFFLQILVRAVFFPFLVSTAKKKQERRKIFTNIETLGYTRIWMDDQSSSVQWRQPLKYDHLIEK